MRKHLKIIFILAAIAIFGYSVSISLHNKTVLKVLANALDNLSHIEFYEALANPSVKYVKVTEGMRKEEITTLMSDTFQWENNDLEAFTGYDQYRDKKFEGKYFPDVYLVPRNISGQELKTVMNQRFIKKTKNVPNALATTTNATLVIASIIQREAAGKNDMNLISGIISNRLKRNMNLQMDATLQYAKGNEENGWWPNVTPADKKIDSPYNTYKNKGLPPTPIANPGLAALSAALNPQKTNFLYYFHKNGTIYASATYAEHKRKINLYLK